MIQINDIAARLGRKMTLEEINAVNLYLGIYNEGLCPEREMNMLGPGRQYEIANKIMIEVYSRN